MPGSVLARRRISRSLFVGRGLGSHLMRLVVRRAQVKRGIAAELYLSEALVKTYVSGLLTKLDLPDRVQLAVLAYESGLVQVGVA